jgi:hypothetical protein
MDRIPRQGNPITIAVEELDPKAKPERTWFGGIVDRRDFIPCDGRGVDYVMLIVNGTISSGEPLALEVPP